MCVHKETNMNKIELDGFIITVKACLAEAKKDIDKFWKKAKRTK